MVRHSVIFKLKFPIGSAEEKLFLKASAELSSIPGVKKFEMLREVSKKNNYDYGISMEFSNYEEYTSYNNHADHQKFLRDFWMSNVQDFLEIDYEPLD